MHYTPPRTDGLSQSNPTHRYICPEGTTGEYIFVRKPYEKLHVNDVGVLADKALENRDYALSIDLIRVIIPMLKQYKGRDVTSIYI